MRVAAVVHQFPPDFTTGTEILCLRSAQALTAKGHEIRVFTADPLRLAGPVREETVQGVPVTRIASARPRRLLLASRIGREFANPAAAAPLLEALRRYRPDVIHLYQSTGFGIEAVPAMATIAPIVATLTDFHLVCPLLTAAFEDGTTCSGPDARAANCVAHLRARERDRLKREGGVKGVALAIREGIRALPGADTDARLGRALERRIAASSAALAAIDLTLVGPPRLYEMLRHRGARVELYGHAAPPIAVPQRAVGDQLCAGYFSSISPHKGLHVLLDAIGDIPQDTGMTFTICGPPGPDPVYVRDMAARAAADKRVTFKAGVPHDQIGAEMGKADIVVIPSLWDENNPLVLLDALEAGRYVVASQSAGMSDTIGGPEGGLCFPAGDAPALAALLADLARDPGPVRHARAHPVRRSNFDTYIDGIEVRYEAVSRHRPEAAATA